jgi:hypothetical protein
MVTAVGAQAPVRSARPDARNEVREANWEKLILFLRKLL